jgi:hypothetical protein
MLPVQEDDVMEVGSVSSSVGSALNAQAQVRSRQPEPDPQTQQSQQAQQSQGAQQAQGSQSSQESEAADRARAEAEKNRPSVNTNGQVVGTRVNTTA